MITNEKIEIYKKIGRDIDHLQRVGSRNEKALMQDNVWSIIDEFIQYLELINKGLAFENFKKKVLTRLESETDCSQTIGDIEKLIGKF